MDGVHAEIYEPTAEIASNITDGIVSLEKSLKLLNKISDGKEKDVKLDVIARRYSIYPEAVYLLQNLNQRIIEAEERDSPAEEYLHVIQTVGETVAENLCVHQGIPPHPQFKTYLGVWALTQSVDDIITDVEDDLNIIRDGGVAYNPIIIGRDSCPILCPQRHGEVLLLKTRYMAELERYVPSDIIVLQTKLRELLFLKDKSKCC